jgi:hypothetical protein
MVEMQIEGATPLGPLVPSQDTIADRADHSGGVPRDVEAVVVDNDVYDAS